MPRQPKMPPIVRCSRCGRVLIEAKPTRARVVCPPCLGLDWEACATCGRDRPQGVCEACYERAREEGGS